MNPTEMPERDALLGHWYLVGTSDRFLCRWPRIDTMELVASADGDDNVRFHALSTSRSGTKRRTASVPAPDPTTGEVGWRGRRGATLLAPVWTVRLSETGALFHAQVRPSLLVPAGGAVFARADVPVARAMIELHASSRQLGLLPRQLHTFTPRDTPADLQRGGSAAMRVFLTEPSPRRLLRSPGH